jgi:8-amino-7-oxononanoate synthase
MRQPEVILTEKRQKQLWRQRQTLTSANAAWVQVQGRWLSNFTTNDYLGLATHPALAQAAYQASQRYGWGSGASPLISGFTAEHQALEAELAEWLNYPAVLIFNSGHAANAGILSSFLEPSDIVIADKAIHASMIDGVLAAQARLLRFPHNDVFAAKKLLQAHPEALFLTEGVFSMDGDSPSLAAWQAELSSRLWFLDDAHGFGIWGEEGRGTLWQQGLAFRPPLLLGTFGKAFGSHGAFIACSTTWRDFFLHEARSLIYSTAMPAAVAAANRQALQLLRHGDARRDKLKENIGLFRDYAEKAGWPLGKSLSAVQWLNLQTAEKALAVQQKLWQSGIWVSAIRPPTVAPGSARLRLSFSASHEVNQIKLLLAALTEVFAILKIRD